MHDVLGLERVPQYPIRDAEQLIDEYRVSVFPYLAGAGTRLFEGLEQPPPLELVSATPFTNGITELAYRRIRQKGD